MDDPKFEQMKQAKEYFHATAMTIPGVHGTSIGVKRVDGKPTDQLAICVHLTRKRPLATIPPDEQIPLEVDGFMTDVIEHAPIIRCDAQSERRAMYEDNSKYRPLVGGTKLSAGYSFGTLGCIVRKPDGSCHALSAAHVLGEAGTTVYQPAKVKCDEIGSTTEVQDCSQMDAAIASLDYYYDAGLAYIREIGAISGTHDIGRQDLPYPIAKRGASTGLTHGSVVAIHYSGVAANLEQFQDMLFIDGRGDEFVDHGDSGSAIVHRIDEDHNLVTGLLWGKAPDANRIGVATPIDRILETFGVSVLTASDPVRASSETLLGRFEAFLSSTQRGKAYWDAYAHNRIYFRHIFHHVPRLAAMWRKMPVPEMIEALREAMLDPDTVIPMKLGAHDTEEVMWDLYEALGKFLQANHQRQLQQQAASFCRLVCGNIGNSWRNALHGIPLPELDASEA
ncbi:S1 family peptidase [Massilia sp. IC2-477]|uniref:S1 family peptidase n=1 Tax=Massilia sp. IC2-477 TaxID=2887198 RepID=UPI001D0FF9CC|nr:S1 family peptidase [Massilia sp. IC2-477]MCC2954382.1 S1 family peptidase [Massilia sp. IC2-477]